MASYTTQCTFCKKVFITLYSLKKHVRERHDTALEDTLIPCFKDQDGREVQVPRPKEISDATDKAGYLTWLAGITERINNLFHPRLPGRWVKIDSHQVPNSYFKHFIWKLGVEVNSIRQVCHKAQPCYQSATLKISYKCFDVEPLLRSLEEQDVVSLHQERLFAGNEICDGEGDLSAEEEIARAKARVYAHAPAQKRKRPSSKSSLTVGYGEGRATREVEIIWWPNLYKLTDNGQLIIRIYVQKCDF